MYMSKNANYDFPFITLKESVKNVNGSRNIFCFALNIIF